MESVNVEQRLLSRRVFLVQQRRYFNKEVDSIIMLQMSKCTVSVSAFVSVQPTELYGCVLGMDRS